MQMQTRIKLTGYISTLLTLVVGFAILYSETGEMVESFVFAALAALMIWGTFIIIGWLARILFK